jgi:putative copper resistance protein D
VVRYGLPIARTVRNLAAALTVGSLLLAAWLIGPAPEEPRTGAAPGAAARPLAGARQRLVRIASVSVGAWLLASAAVLVLTVADVAGVPLRTPGFAGLVASFVTQVDLGRALAVSLLLVAVVANLTVLATRAVTTAWAAVLALVALLPLALAGHGGGSANHMNSVDSLALHLVSVSVWVGGLGALLIVGRHLGPQLPAVVRRYSTLAGWCFVVVALSGTVNAVVRVGSLANLTSPYGLLVGGKVLALGLLGVAGWRHRSANLSRLDAEDRRGAFWRLAAGELVVMGATIGLAVALANSAPPEPEVKAEDPVAALLGYPAPPPLTPTNYLTAFYPELLWLAVAVAMLGLYGWGVLRLRRRRDAWPINRTILWTLGCLVLIFITSGGPGVYGRMSFSAHMGQHMSLMIMVPLLLVFGAPITLALRTLAPRSDGSLGLRETLLALMHSRVLRVLGHPVVASALFTGSLVVFYYTGLFELSLSSRGGHVLMTAHFLLTGYLFVWALVGLDPGPARPPYPLRLLLLLVTLAFHSFFAISLTQSSTVLALDWWQSLGQTDVAALLKDQQTGASIAWATGDLPGLGVGVALVLGWVRSDAAERRRTDRQADRDSDADLRAYNERLAAMARRDSER